MQYVQTNGTTKNIVNNRTSEDKQNCLLFIVTGTTMTMTMTKAPTTTTTNTEQPNKMCMSSRFSLYTTYLSTYFRCIPRIYIFIMYKMNLQNYFNSGLLLGLETRKYVVYAKMFWCFSLFRMYIWILCKFICLYSVFICDFVYDLHLQFGTRLFKIVRCICIGCLTH